MNIDHVVGNVELGKMDYWVEFYERVFGMTNIIHFGDDDIQTEYSALMSKVMADGKREDQVPDQRAGRGQAQEPDRGVPRVLRRRRRAAHRARVDRHRRHGRGAQGARLPLPRHARLVLRRGARTASARSPRTTTILQEHKILVDRDDDGYLLQIFTKTAQDRPTVFFEVIERHGATTFGEGNFKALFEAIEREQALRGNL